MYYIWRGISWLGGVPGVFIPVLGLSYHMIHYIHTNHLRSPESDLACFSLIIICYGGILVAYIIGIIIKCLYYMPRPVPMDTSTFLKKIVASSMPSMHSCVTLIYSYTFAGLMSITNPTYTLSRYVLAFVWIILMGYARIKLQRHYYKDVVVGYILGILIIICIIRHIDFISTQILGLIPY